MPRPKAKTAPDGSAKPPTAAEQAEKSMRDTLSNGMPLVNYKTGMLQSGGKLNPFWQRLKRSGNCRLGSVVQTNPAVNTQATMQDHYKHGQQFSVFNPCVSAAAAGLQQLVCSLYAAAVDAAQTLTTVKSQLLGAGSAAGPECCFPFL